MSNEYLGHGGLMYRPLVWLGYIFDRHLWGASAAGFHLTNLILYWAAGVVTFLLLRTFRVPPGVSVLTALVWLGLPINSEAVAWISGRFTIQCSLLILLSLLVAARPVTSTKLISPALYGLASLAALLSNEWGLLVFPLTLGVLWLKDRRPQRAWRMPGSAALCALLVYAALRSVAGAWLPVGSPGLLPVGSAVFRYIAWILLPVRMSVERSSDTPPDALSIQSICALAALLALCAAALVVRKRLPLISTGILWTVALLVPFSGIVFIYQGMAERYTTLASIGLVLSIVAAAFQFRAGKRYAAIALVLIWAGWGFLRLHQRLAHWKSEELLFADSLRATPESAVLLYNLGTICAQSGRTDQAIAYYRKSLFFRERSAPALINLANLLARKGDFATALSLLNRAAVIAPRDPDPFVDMGNIHLQTGSIEAARRCYEKALVLNPLHLEATVDLGTALQYSGDLSGAVRQYRKAIFLDPHQGAPYCDLAAVLAKQKNTASAIQVLQAGIANNPSFAPAYFNLGVLYQQKGNRGQARKLYENALTIDPNYEHARRNLSALLDEY